MRVAIINAFGDNFGDFLNLASTIDFVEKRLKSDNITVIYHPQAFKHTYTSGRRQIQTLELPRNIQIGKTEIQYHAKEILHDCSNQNFWVTLENIVKEHDFILSPPSGQSIGIYKDYAFLSPYIVAKRMNKPFGLFFATTQSSGDAEFDDISKFVLEGGIVSVRDRKSQEFLRESRIKDFGVNEATFHFVRSINYLNTGEFNFNNFEQKAKRVIFVFGDSLEWHPKNALFQEIDGDNTINLKIIKSVMEIFGFYGAEYVLLPHSPLNKELDHLIELSRQLKAKCVLIPHIKTLDEYLSNIASADLVVSIRYHGAVTASALNIPTLAIAYENKTSQFMATIDKHQFVIELENVKEDLLKNKIKQLIEQDHSENYVKGNFERDTGKFARNVKREIRRSKIRNFQLNLKDIVMSRKLLENIRKVSEFFKV